MDSFDGDDADPKTAPSAAPANDDGRDENGGGTDASDAADAHDDDATPTPTPTPAAARTPCTAPAGVSNDPQSIEDVVALINALPKPVTIACYLDVLKRPLALNATASTQSVQPALSATSPRVFLFAGNLITAIAIDGSGKNLLELSTLINNQTSVKGEIAFPVTDALPLGAAYTHVKRTDVAGTRCAACHFGDAAVNDAARPNAFSSKALRPFTKDDVPLSALTQERAKCAGSTTPRCDVLNALFGHGEVQPRAFPSDMPTLF